METKQKKKGGKRNSDKETIFQRESRRSNRKQTATNRKRQKVSAEGVAVLLQLESGRRIPQLGLNRAEQPINNQEKRGIVPSLHLILFYVSIDQYFQGCVNASGCRDQRIQTAKAFGIDCCSGRIPFGLLGYIVFRQCTIMSSNASVHQFGFEAVHSPSQNTVLIMSFSQAP